MGNSFGVWGGTGAVHDHSTLRNFDIGPRFSEIDNESFQIFFKREGVGQPGATRSFAGKFTLENLHCRWQAVPILCQGRYGCADRPPVWCGRGGGNHFLFGSDRVIGLPRGNAHVMYSQRSEKLWMLGKISWHWPTFLPVTDATVGSGFSLHIETSQMEFSPDVPGEKHLNMVSGSGDKRYTYKKDTRQKRARTYRHVVKMYTWTIGLLDKRTPGQKEHLERGRKDTSLSKRNRSVGVHLNVQYFR